MTRVQRKVARLCLIVAALMYACAAHGEDALTLIKRIDLPGVSGRIDHMAVDIETHWLYVAALGNNSVEVVDLQQGTVVKSLRGFAEPQGVLLLPDRAELFVTNGANRYVDVYDTRSLRRARQIELKDDNDNIRYEPTTKQVYVGCGAEKQSALCVISATGGTKVKEVTLSGHPESFQLEREGSRVFVNVPTSGCVEVVDRRQRRVVASWPVAAKKNFPMAFDEKHGRLFIGTRAPAKLVVLDTTTGHQVAALDSVGDADDIFYEPATGRIYVSGGEGFVYMFERQGADQYRLLSRVATSKGARTALYVPQWNQLIVAAPKSSSGSAHLLVYALGAAKPKP